VALVGNIVFGQKRTLGERKRILRPPRTIPVAILLVEINVILMYVSPLVTPYSSFLHLFVSKSFFMSFVNNFRKGKWTTIPMEKSLKEKHQGHRGLQDLLLNIGYPTIKILRHQTLRETMEMRIHPPSLVLTF
jgi:hypothetical protein